MVLIRLVLGLIIAFVGLGTLAIGVPLLVIPPVGLGLISAGMTVMMGGLALAGGFSNAPDSTKNIGR